MFRRINAVRDFMLRHHIRELARCEDAQEAERHFREISALVMDDPAVRRILKLFKAGESQLRELFDFLMYGGADCWIHGTYVAASSITKPIIIYAYLRDREKRADRNFQRGFADTCVRYFEGGYNEMFLCTMLSVPADYDCGWLSHA
jgi:hypothetical protein